MPRYTLAISALLTALTVLLASTGDAAEEARVVQLKHRSAEEIIPIIRPLLGPDDTLTGMDYRLIIRTSDKNLKEIESLLAQLDIAQRRLRITVEQAVATERAAVSQSITGEARVGNNARVILPARPPGDRGIAVQKDNIRYNANRRAATASGSNIQTITTLDGQRAYIRIGQSVPYVQKILALSRNQITIAQGIAFQDITTGFTVLTHVHGDRVRVEITPRLSTLENPATGLANFQELTTTVEAKLGEWIDLGAILSGGNEIQRAILESAATESGERRTVRLKIE